MLELHLYPQTWPCLTESTLGRWIRFCGVDVEVEVISLISRPSAALQSSSDVHQARQVHHHQYHSSLPIS